jgi:PAS domain S-box-containing protein
MDAEARYRRFDEAAQNGILILDAESGAILDMNPILAKMLDYAPVELLGMSLWEIGLPEDVAASKRAFQCLIENNSVHYDDLPFVSKSGEPVRVEVTGKVFDRRGEKLVQCNVCRIGLSDSTIGPEMRIQHTHEMEAVSQIAGGLAHDLNNMLGVILRCCEILEGQQVLPEASHKIVLEIHNAGASARNLTERMLAFSRGQVAERVAVDLNETVSRVEKMLGRLFGDGVLLVTVPGSGLGSISADPSQLEQVLMNLAINARDAMPRGGRIMVETANVEIDETNAGQHPSVRPGRYVVLSVSDTGTGMDPEIQSRIFEPFFTTKPFGQGTGLGLSTVMSIVEQNGGAISVHSQPGAGATFKIYFPRCDQPVVAARQAKAPLVQGEAKTILLVDDAGSLRGLIRRLLEDGGYTVLDSGDPAVALRIAQEHPGPIPLLITDVVLPGFSGSDLAARVTRTRPETRVLYVSGFNDDSVAPLLPPGRSYAFLKKPFTQDELLRNVRQLLDSSMTIPARPPSGSPASRSRRAKKTEG